MTQEAVVAETAMGFSAALLSEAGVCRATLFLPTRNEAIRDLTGSGTVEFDTGARGREVEALLVDFASGHATLDDFPVDICAGTDFQRHAWRVLREVPRGETRTYGWVTRRLGLPPGAARAVGAAVGANRIPLWVPCHRIIGSDGSLHGFAGGLEMKRKLLELEGALPPAFA